jgi:hypothetical protein
VANGDGGVVPLQQLRDGSSNDFAPAFKKAKNELEILSGSELIRTAK